MEFDTAEDIRKALINHYPEVNDDEFSISHSGFVHDHPMIPIGVVLISAFVLGTTDPVKLTQFTGYSLRFVSGIASNMENAGLWKKNKYDSSSWFCGGVLPSTEAENHAYWEHIQIAEGTMWTHGTDHTVLQNTCLIFWDDMLAEAKSRGIMLWRRGKRVA